MPPLCLDFAARAPPLLICRRRRAPRHARAATPLRITPLRASARYADALSRAIDMPPRHNMRRFARALLMRHAHYAHARRCCAMRAPYAAQHAQVLFDDDAQRSCHAAAARDATPCHMLSEMRMRAMPARRHYAI